MADFDPKKRRSLVINVRAVIDQLIAGYKDKERRVSHWVQKDGIQNCWDARKDPRNKLMNWKCEIELIEQGNDAFVTITDYGTWGLTGRRYDRKDLEQKDLPREERWCRFENFAFANENVKNQHLLGSRGRGKFVFSGASDTMETLYDTLRDDKVYRLGMRTVEKLDAPNDFEEDQMAKDILKTKTKGILAPLNHVGSRIIIMNPTKELVEDIKDGHMEQFVSETWWEIIEKFGAKIIVKHSGKSFPVKPFTESLPESAKTQTKISRPKTSRDQKVFIKNSVPIPNSKFRIKKLYILYDPDRSFDDRQLGISIQRAGMSITRLPMTELGSGLSDHMTGYATFEEGFENEMRKTEGPEHYSYNWSSKPTSDLGFALKKLYREFAMRELGWKETKSAKATKSDRKANDRARNKANEIAKKMGFGKGTHDPPPPPPPPPVPRTPKIVAIQLNNLGFPITGTERVNYGESIKNIGARVINNSDNNIKVGIKIEVRSVERDEQVYGKFIYTNSNFSSSKNSPSSYCCNKTIDIEKTDFTPGQYKVKASLALLTPFGKLRKGQELDVSTKSFFVQVDPPKGGIWEDFIAVDFSNYDGDQKSRRAFHDIGSRPGTYVLKYNKEHADHKMIKDTDEKSIAQYRYRLTIPELCLLDINKKWNIIFTEDDRKQGIGRIAEVMKNTEDKYTDTKFIDDV
jgi:hypothetical protein